MRDITTDLRVASGNDRAIPSDGSKRTFGGLDFRNSPQMILDIPGIATLFRVPPGNDGTICPEGCKCKVSGLDLFRV